MKNIRSVKFNFLMNLILTSSNLLFPLITFPYISRVLQPEGTGKIAFATSFITYFLIFASFGVATYGVRAIAQVRDHKEKLSKTTYEIVLINLFMMLMSYGILIISLFIFEKLWNEKELLLTISLTVVFTILSVEWFYKGIEQYQYITYRTILFKFISLIATFIFINNRNDYISFAIITVFSIAGSSILNIINIRKYIELRYCNTLDLKKHIKPMFLFFVTSFAIAIYTNTDSTMLGIMISDSETGYYNAAIRIKGILLSFVTSLGIVLLPRLSYYIQHNMQTEFIYALSRSVNFIILSTIPIATFIVLFSEEIIYLLVGEEYSLSILPLKIVALTIIFVGLTNILGIQILVPLKKEKQLLVSVSLAAIFNIAINIYLIPKYGATGAAISTTASEFLVLVTQCYFVKGYLKSIFCNIQYWKFIISLCLSLLATVFFQKMNNLFLYLLLIAFLFFGVYVIVLFILKEDFIYKEIYLKIKEKII